MGDSAGRPSARIAQNPRRLESDIKERKCGIGSGSPLPPLDELLPTSGTLRHNVGHLANRHTARRSVAVLWFGPLPSISRKGEPMGKERKKGARVKTTLPPILSIPRVTLRNNPPPTTRRVSLASLVTIRYKQSPIDSPILRSTNRGMRIAYKIRNADPPDGIDHHCL